MSRSHMPMECVEGGPKLIVADDHQGWFYQGPVITEKACIGMATRPGEIFVHAPWATLIDQRGKQPPDILIRQIEDRLADLRREHPDKVVATAAQHIWFARLANLWWSIGIRRVYASHKPKGVGRLIPSWRGSGSFLPNLLSRWRGIELRPLPLYPVNILDRTRRIGLMEIPFESRRYSFSFIGAPKELDLHPIRETLIDPAWLQGQADVQIRATKVWHFEREVYGIGPEKETLRQQNLHYNEVLSQSRFSLCPVGAGPNTIRLWESLCVGAVPIIISESFDMEEFLPKGLSAYRVCLQLPYDHPALVSAAALKAHLESVDGPQMSIMGRRLAGWLQRHGWFADREWREQEVLR